MQRTFANARRAVFREGSLLLPSVLLGRGTTLRLTETAADNLLHAGRPGSVRRNICGMLRAGRSRIHIQTRCLRTYFRIKLANTLPKLLQPAHHKYMEHETHQVKCCEARKATVKQINPALHTSSSLELSAPLSSESACLTCTRPI